MASDPTKVLMVSTSYPRDMADWQGLFIRKIADTMGASPDLAVSLWAPDGPRHPEVGYACTEADRQWLEKLTRRGGMAHLLRSRPLTAVGSAGVLLGRLRRLYREQGAATDIFHINWLQNAVPLSGRNCRAVITVLGADFKMLKLPGMVALLRGVLKTNQCILAPNAAWMKQPLERHFGDLAPVRPVNFGIDEAWYGLQCQPPGELNRWLCVLRITEDKIGHLFEWGEQEFTGGNELHLVGPNQSGMRIPEWVHYHGPLPASELIENWYPRCVGFITLSEHSEGKPQVLLETMAAGMPVIASRIPAHEETVQQGEQGCLVSSREQLGEALDRLGDPETHARMAQNCRAASAGEYGNWSDCLGRYRELYEELL